MIRNMSAFERAMRLAVVSGLKASYGPALLTAAGNRPERRTLALAALAEMVFDKLPLVPRRSSLPLLIPRVISGYWVTKTSLEHDGIEDPIAAPIGAAVAAGVATFAPILRAGLGRILGTPDFLLGAAEDYLALRLGADAVGMSMDEVKELGQDALSDVKDRAVPIYEDAKERIRHAGSNV
jgi:hypothetical protein